MVTGFSNFEYNPFAGMTASNSTFAQKTGNIFTGQNASSSSIFANDEPCSLFKGTPASDAFVDKPANTSYAMNTSSYPMNGTTAGVMNVATSLLGVKPGDSKHKEITQGRVGEAWCADTVSYIYEKSLGKCPWGYRAGGNYKARVDELHAWGKQQGLYKRKESIGIQNIKPGDIVIFKDDGASHTGIVESVDSNGKIHTIEGNTSNKCARREYSITNSRLSGFVSMSGYLGGQQLVA